MNAKNAITPKVGPITYFFILFTIDVNKKSLYFLKEFEWKEMFQDNVKKYDNNERKVYDY